MPTNYTGRILLILAVLAASLWAIFPSGNPKRPDLKPGIDMVGGTSLLYEIKPPEGGATFTENLAEEVAASLKKRVDPDGVRNLIWRPQGNTRLEIQMPLTRTSGEAAAKREAYSRAQRDLEATNVRVNAVLNAVETRTGDDRRIALEQLAQGSDKRSALFGALASAWDRIQQAKQRQDAEAQAAAENEYDELKRDIADTNLTAAELEGVLAQGAEARDKRLAELKQQFAGFPARAAAIDAFAKAYADYNQVKGSLDDATDLKRLLRGSGVLEFHILVDRSELTPELEQTMLERLQKGGGRPVAGDTMRWFEVDQPGQVGGITQPYGGKEYVLAWITPDKSMVNREGQNPWGLASARRDRDQFGTEVVAFRFDPQGARNFGELTTNHRNRQLAIMLDDKVISAPNIDEPITGGSGIIRGGSDGFSQAELSYLTSTLSAGSLPAKLADDPISERTVGPQLGKDNLRRGLYACAFGLVVVAVFMIGYYYVAGVVAFFAVLMNMVIILGVMAMFNATFTLPSVAGIVLTIGMAVDANVLIFERLREEQQRGLSLRMALRNAYDRAFSAILDGNVTTGITAAALYAFGSEEVKGFGLTLLIGIVASLFTALFVTKTIFGLLIDRFELRRLGSLPLTFPRWDQLLRPNVNWMRLAPYAYTFSAAFIVIGLVLFGARMAQGRMMDIEFASGTSVQFELKEPTPIEEVRRLVNAVAERRPDDLPAPSVVSVGTDERTYEVVTPKEGSGPVKQAVIEALGDRLRLELPSRFQGVGQTLDLALTGGQIVPIRNAEQSVGGIDPAALAEHVGGAAIVLADLDPPLRPSEIHDRIERERLQPQAGEQAPSYREFDVVSELGNDEPARTAVVLVSDPAFPYEQDETKWREELVGPMWQLVGGAVAGEADLQRVSKFDAQVAGETQREAVVALVLSILGIMAYIWVRFGNLKYGTATVIALLHDTLFVLGAIGFAHVLANTFVGDALLLEPFRINLTMVAAVLTVMGYSMNDTVVVFDRIRENRGKLGHVSRQTVNDSINQTLSRTLLTGGTTILTIFVMYVFGGAGIHGFTFALLVGILVGTYSSICIAAPILLVGGAPEEKSGPGGTRPAESRQPAGQLQRV